MEYIDITKLEVGTKLEITTKNSVYFFEITNKNNYVIGQGGKYIPQKKTVYILNKIIKQGIQMIIFTSSKKYITTSSVKSAKIIGKTWEYQMWE